MVTSPVAVVTRRGGAVTVLVLTPQIWDSPLLPLLGTEIAKDEPGQQAVLDRMFDLLLIAAVQAWFARPDLNAPVWYRARADPIVGRGLARVAGRPLFCRGLSRRWPMPLVCRAPCSPRFAELVGEPPMTYRTSWRLALAADLLLDPALPSSPSPAPSGTATASRSAARSSECAASARPSHGTGQDRSLIKPTSSDPGEPELTCVPTLLAAEKSSAVVRASCTRSYALVPPAGCRPAGSSAAPRARVRASRSRNSSTLLRLQTSSTTYSTPGRGAHDTHHVIEDISGGRGRA